MSPNKGSFLLFAIKTYDLMKGMIYMNKEQLEILLTDLVIVYNNLVIIPEDIQTNTKRLAKIINALQDHLLKEES